MYHLQQKLPKTHKTGIEEDVSSNKGKKKTGTKNPPGNLKKMDWNY
jgi:hypothetical protein